ncbi:hypothetical protein L3Y34_019618 [Caenorhabditis briggsae]|uniref:Uncharacterized protein n=1 Tax=Caenorhabditis briggsae TaxID=6238 RepID=A0AAE9DP68_CAEBR|nr:hypothetical protein L3Y34_019618 [Caenorhabditis briggsae]
MPPSVRPVNGEMEIPVKVESIEEEENNMQLMLFKRMYLRILKLEYDERGREKGWKGHQNIYSYFPRLCVRRLSIDFPHFIASAMTSCVEVSFFPLIFPRNMSLPWSLCA